MQELQITMLGARGVGKTTLLTAMYDHFENKIGKTNLQLTPDEESAFRFQDRLIELKSLLDIFEAKDNTVGVRLNPVPDKIDDIPIFQFDLGKKGGKGSLKLKFCDYSGEYFTKNKEHKKFVEKLVSESHVVLIAIDSPALMEENGKYHDRINRPLQIKSFFNSAYQDLKDPRLVILAPVKCEKYLEKEESTNKLLYSIQEGYAPLLEHFQAESLKNNIAVVITPVQTVGGVKFSRVDVDELGVPHFYFRKFRYDAKYNPQDSDQPLKYLLRFLLKLHLQDRRGGMFDFLRDWLGLDKHLKKAVEEFSRDCKTTDGFKVVQGDSLLSI